jgi:hypothetical protein
MTKTVSRAATRNDIVILNFKTGVVTDALTGLPLEGVKVTMDGLVTYTNAEGRYLLWRLSRINFCHAGSPKPS